MSATDSTETRVVTDDQARFYQQHGWVKVPGFVDSATVEAMLEQALRLEHAAESGSGGRDLAMWREWRFIARDGAQPFATLAYSQAPGRAISELEGHGGAIRYWNDILTRKAPADSASGNTGTGWHQDFPNHPLDRVGGATIWVALEDLEPDQGTMSFLSGSHRAGPLGRTYSTGPTSGGTDQVAQNPWLLEQFPRSEPLSLRAGDVTFHHPLTVHGTDPNVSDRPRRAFIVMYIAAGSVYTGATYPATDELGLEPGGHFDHPNFPVVWGGAA